MRVGAQGARRTGSPPMIGATRLSTQSGRWLGFFLVRGGGIQQLALRADEPRSAAADRTGVGQYCDHLLMANSFTQTGRLKLHPGSTEYPWRPGTASKPPARSRYRPNGSGDRLKSSGSGHLNCARVPRVRLPCGPGWSYRLSLRRARAVEAGGAGEPMHSCPLKPVRRRDRCPGGEARS